MARSSDCVVRLYGKPFLLALALVLVYGSIAWLARGDSQWWHIDFIHGGNAYWGDNSYRYYLAKSAWLNTDIYWFNFVLPVAIFLDAVIVALSGDSLFYAHAIKSLPLVASLFFIYHSCVAVGVKRHLSFLSVAFLSCSPLYVFISLSFYGESWFAFFVSLGMFLLAKKKNVIAALVIGLMPLVRIEGLNFVAVFTIFCLMEKGWRPLFAVFFPGAVYFLLVVLVGPGISEFLSWRFEAAKVYEGVGLWYGGDPSRVIDILSWPWLILALFGFFMKAARPLLILFLGAALIVLQLTLTVASEMGNFEPRFLVVAFPVMTAGLALSLSRIEAFLENIKNAAVVALSGVAILVLSSGASSVHIVKELFQYVSEYGRLPSAVTENPFRMSVYFKKTDAEKVSGYREYADVAMRMIEENPDVKILMVSDPNVLYFLDPNRLYGKVDVVFALFGWPTLRSVIEGDVTYGYFPTPPFSSYYALSFPRSGETLLLYLDEMRIEGYPYHWIVRGNHIYLFAASMSGVAKIKKYRED